MSTSGELFCLLLFALLAFSHAYQKYAKSLKLPKPFNDNVYKFELNVTRQMTMTRKRKNDKVELVDYNPNTQTWTARDRSLPQGYRVLNESDLDSVSVGDGLHKLKVFINGQTPGPTLVVPLNATVIIKVRNQQAAEQMTFHVHGIKKQDRWFADGVPFVQQCPVLASTTYTYKFIADTPGTHWYHGHVGLDQLEGLLGAFVVIDPNEPKVDHDYVALLDDEPVRPTPENRYLDHNNLEKSYNGVDEEFKPYECRANHDGAHTGNCIPTETITVNGIGWHEQNHETKNVPHVIFRTSESEKTRIRFINGGRYNALQVTISSHVLTVTAVDGVQIEPVKVSKMIIYPGERYDVVLYKNHCPYPGQQSGYIQIETLDATGQSVTQISKLEYKDVLRKSYCDFHTHWLFILNCPFLKQTDSYYEQCVLPTHLRPIQETDSEVVQKKFFESGFEEHFYNCASRNGFSYKYPTSIPYFHQYELCLQSMRPKLSCQAN
ncbi:hypothetical protein L596_028919 [Steinernema carpocapsae]|uniref:Plastocyanin-like domain-containing protein n=1 Tax=Steinernema carpocapsae TaxID=34508 RepID=A0A4U5LZR1_STECR|nr:hypothetical protein L596_028919 [Steinernema carpocapsae]